MPVLKLLTFQGEIPRVPADKLPDNAAQYASNCDFAHGELRGLRDSKTVDDIPPYGAPGFTAERIVAIYSEDGERFFAWPWETDVVKSQVVGDIYNRIFYTGIPGDGPIIKVARTARTNYTATTGTTTVPVIGNVALLGGKYRPPEATSPAPWGNGNGPDSWMLGIPLPQVQGWADTDKLTAVLVDKATWPGVPKLKLRVTFFVESTAGEILYQLDISNTENGIHPYPATAQSVTYEQCGYTNDWTQRGNKIQDMMFPLNIPYGRGAAPYKFFWCAPPNMTSISLSRTVTITNPSTASGPITIEYSSVATAPPVTTTPPGSNA